MSYLCGLIKRKMDLTFREIVTHRDWRDFIEFPKRLFKGNAHFIPSLDSDEHDSLYREKNPAYGYCDAKFWLAESDGKAVGRVGAIINRRANEKWNEKFVRFGWFDFIDDFEVCKALVGKVVEFGKQHGMTKIQGPLGFTDMDKECWVTEGFENRQNICTLYNPPYYIDFIKRLGFAVDCEWLQYKIPASQPVPEKVRRVSRMIAEKYKVRLLEFTKVKDILKYAHKVFHCLNDAFSILYGFVELTETEIDNYTRKYFQVLDPELVKLVVDENDDVIAFAIAMPCLDEAFRKINGRLIPFGWVRVLHDIRHYRDIDFLLNGVSGKWQGKGIHALYHLAMNETMIRKKLRYAYSNPQIDGNMAVKVWTSQYECEQNFRRAVFSREI